MGILKLHSSLFARCCDVQFFMAKALDDQAQRQLLSRSCVVRVGRRLSSSATRVQIWRPKFTRICMAILRKGFENVWQLADC